MSNRNNSAPVKSVLSDLGWDEGFSIPVANFENKTLEDEVQKLQALIIARRNEENSLGDGMAATTEHLKNVSQELQNTLGIVNARKKETESEEHLRLVAERESGRLKQEIHKLEKDHDECKEKRNISENNIFTQSQKLEELKSQMNWDQQALEAWLEESARKDEDAMMLAKYSHTDDGKIKEMSLRMEKLTEDMHHKKKVLDTAVTDTMASQIELDKTAEDFRKAHVDRQNLIQQWENTIEQMQTRDKEMDLLASQLARVRVEIRQLEEDLREKDNFLSQNKENNEEEEKKIQLVERTSGKVHHEFREAETNRQQFHSELDALKRTVDRTAMDLEVTRSSVTHLKKDIAEKTVKMENVKDIRIALIDKLRIATESTLSAEERQRQLDEYLSSEAAKQKETELVLKAIREQKLRKTEQLGQLRNDEKICEAQIQGNTACIRNLNSKLNKMDHDSLKQQEISYNQDFEIQQLERRISRMQGERSNDEQSVLEAKLVELQEEIDIKGGTIVQLGLQLKKLQDDIRRVATDLDRGRKAKDLLTNKIEELDLYNDSTERELKVTIRQKQDTMVDGNLLKLELKRLRDCLNDKADGVLTNEKRKLQLETAIKERRTEIDVHRAMLQAQVKASDEERSQINAELHERISKIDKLRKRYEILMVSMAPPEGEEDHSQAYYVIKAAQEKEELQREGDDLDARIRKAEKEIQALENTVRLMNSRNETYRKSFNKVTDSSDEMDVKEQMDEQLRAVTDKYKYKRRQISEIEDDLQAMGSTLDTLSRDEDAYVEMYNEKKNKVGHLNKDLDEQKAKLDRTDKQMARIRKDIRVTQSTKEQTPEERDITVREWRDFNRNIMKQVSESVQHNPELQETVNLVFTQANLPPPGTKVSGPPSARSSASSLRSGIKSMSPALDTPLTSPSSTSSKQSARSGSGRL